MAKRKKAAHLATLLKIEAHFKNLKKFGFDVEGGRKLKVLRSVYFMQCSLEILSEMIIPKRAIKRAVARLIKMRDEPRIIGALFDPLCRTVDELERRA